jgi:hypothetical protein
MKLPNHLIPSVIKKPPIRRLLNDPTFILLPNLTKGSQKGIGIIDSGNFLFVAIR